MVRAKQRYILCEIIQDPKYQKKINFEQEAVYVCIKAAIQAMHGDYGTGILQRSLNVKYWNTESNILLIRAKRGAHILVIQAMAMLKRVGEVDALFRTLHVSGTIRACQKFLAKHHKGELVRSLGQCETTKERKLLKKLINECEQNCKDRVKKEQKKKPFFALSIDSSDEEIET